MTDDLWKDMLIMGAGSVTNRQRRQAYGGYGARGVNNEPSGSLPTTNLASGPLSVGLGNACSLFFF